MVELRVSKNMPRLCRGRRTEHPVDYPTYDPDHTYTAEEAIALSDAQLAWWAALNKAR